MRFSCVDIESSVAVVVTRTEEKRVASGIVL